LESGGDLTYTTWWSTDDDGITVGKGDQTGNALQLIWEVRKQKEKLNGEMKPEHVDKLIQSLKIKVLKVFQLHLTLNLVLLISYVFHFFKAHLKKIIPITLQKKLFLVIV